jgi:Eukaryotic aspartyl protease
MRAALAPVALLLLLSCASFSSAAPLLKKGGAKEVEVPLLGDFHTIFMYYADVSVGSNPPQHFTATVDTGSSDFLVPQLGCTGCYGGKYVIHIVALVLPAPLSDLPLPPLFEARANTTTPPGATPPRR